MKGRARSRAAAAEHAARGCYQSKDSDTTCARPSDLHTASDLQFVRAHGGACVRVSPFLCDRPNRYGGTACDRVMARVGGVRRVRAFSAVM